MKSRQCSSRNREGAPEGAARRAPAAASCPARRLQNSSSEQSQASQRRLEPGSAWGPPWHAGPLRPGAGMGQGPPEQGHLVLEGALSAWG